jgi:hypothetical protein
MDGWDVLGISKWIVASVPTGSEYSVRKKIPPALRLSVIASNEASATITVALVT